MPLPYAETRKDCERLKASFKKAFEAYFPQAVETLERDWDKMMTFYNFPKENWKHIRTTNVVESTFASVRLRTNAAKRHQRVSNATALIWKVIMVAEQRFKRLSALQLLAEVYYGVKFKDGKRVTEIEKEGAAT